jgi:uncharacterized protein (TIRG00374 family)
VTTTATWRRSESATAAQSRAATSDATPRWKQPLRSAAGLVVGGIAVYLLLPSLMAVFGSWRSLSHLDWPFLALTLAAEAASLVCLWQLDRIALHTREWFPVVTSQLAGNAVGRLLPGGGATSTAFSASMLRTAGIGTTGEAWAALTAASVLQVATALALPALALPAILAGAPVAHDLAGAAYLGAAVLFVLVAAGIAAFASDTPLTLAGRAAQGLLNATVRRHDPVADVPQRLLAVRDFVRQTIGRRWQAALLAAAGNTGFDYLALLAALSAVGADPQPALVVLAYAAAKLLALVPLTPGGLGFVEAGLVGMLALAGVSGGDAVTATLLYRMVAFWLPLPAGALAYVLFRGRYGAASAPRSRPSSGRSRT